MIPLIPIALALMGGIILGNRFHMEPVFFLTGTPVFVVCLWFFRYRDRVFTGFLIVFFVLTGSFWVGLYDRLTAPTGLELRKNTDVFCLGEVRGNSVRDVDFYGRKRQRFTLSLRMLSGAKDEEVNLQKRVRGRVLVTLYGHHEGVEAGDRVVVRGHLKEVPSRTNPGTFNRRKWLGTRSVFWEMTIRSIDDIVRVRPGWGWMHAFDGLRYRGLALIERYIPEPAAGLAKALALGDRASIEHTVKDRFMETGTVHLLAISGLHVGILAGMILFVLRRLIGSIPVRTGLAILLLVVYVPLTGAAVPVVRSVFLFSTLLLGRLLGRGISPINALAFAALVLIIGNPHTIEEIGFQFSFGAVLSILIMAPRMIERLDVTFGKNRAGRFGVRLFAVSFAAWLGLVPAIMARFHLFTPVTIPAGFVVLPLLMPVLAMLIAFFLLAPFSSFAGHAAGQAAAWFLAIFSGAVDLFWRIPFGFFYTVSPPLWLLAALYIAIAVWFFRRRLRRFYSAVLLVLLLIGCIWTGTSFANRLLRPAELVLTFLDVGQGDALVIESPQGSVWVVDAGRGMPFDRGRSVVAPYLWRQGHQWLSGVIMTHADTDHAGGLAAVTRRFPFRWALEGPVPDAGPAYVDYVRATHLKGIRRATLYRGDRIVGAEGFEITCLHPPRSWAQDPDISDNDRSLVLRVQYGHFTALLTADIESKGIRSLLESDQDLSANVLKVPHHGAKIPPELLAVFLKRVHPEAAVISVGRNNAYGHPDSETAGQIAETCALYRTDHSGALTVRTDGNAFQVEEYVSDNALTL